MTDKDCTFSLMLFNIIRLYFTKNIKIYQEKIQIIFYEDVKIMGFAINLLLIV